MNILYPKFVSRPPITAVTRSMPLDGTRLFLSDVDRVAHAVSDWMMAGISLRKLQSESKTLLARFIIRSILKQNLPLAKLLKEVIIFAYIDKRTMNSCLLTVFCYFKSRDEAIEWRTVLQMSKGKIKKQRESEKQRLKILRLYFYTWSVVVTSSSMAPDSLLDYIRLR